MGVIAVITIALLIVFAVVVYAVFHKVVVSKRKRKERFVCFIDYFNNLIIVLSTGNFKRKLTSSPGKKKSKMKSNCSGVL